MGGGRVTLFIVVMVILIVLVLREIDRSRR